MLRIHFGPGMEANRTCIHFSYRFSPQVSEQSPRYEFYSYEKTKIVQKPIPRYDRTCGKYADTLLNRAPRYDPRSDAYPGKRLKIITWNVLN